MTVAAAEVSTVATFLTAVMTFVESVASICCGDLVYLLSMIIVLKTQRF